MPVCSCSKSKGERRRLICRHSSKARQQKQSGLLLCWYMPVWSCRTSTGSERSRLMRRHSASQNSVACCYAGTCPCGHAGQAQLKGGHWCTDTPPAK
jgi:hypothetical protein